MGYGDDYWGLYRGYYRDPFPTKHQTVTETETGTLGPRTPMAL